MSGLDDLFGAPSNDLDDPFADIGRSPATEVNQEANIDQVLAGHDTSTVYTSIEHTVNEANTSHSSAHAPLQNVEQEPASDSSHDGHGQSQPHSVPTDYVNQPYTYNYSQPVYSSSPYAPATAQPPSIQTTGQSQDVLQHTVTGMKQSPYAPAQSQYTPAPTTQGPYVPKNAQSTPTQNPYAPQTIQTFSTQGPYVPQSSQATSTYSPYVPQNNQATSTYSPYVPQSVQTTSAQSPYAPAPQPQHKPPASIPPSQYNTNSATIPTPPAPRVPLNRPTISNAYDPPFPTTTSTTTRRRLQPNTYDSTAALPPPSSRPPQHPRSSPTEPHLHRNTVLSGLHQPFIYEHGSIEGLPHPSAPPSNLFATQVSSATVPSSPPAALNLSSPSIAADQVPGLNHHKDNLTLSNGIGDGHHSSPAGVIERTGSPTSIYSLNGDEAKTSPMQGGGPDLGSPSGDPYAPTKTKVNGFAQDVPPPRLTAHHPTPSMRYVPQTDVSRNRSMSNGSTYSNVSTEDHYSPGQRNRQGISHADYMPRHDNPNMESGGSTLAPPQEITIKASTLPPYAPSPSLIGTNDPLGRTSARAPVFSFGFGGKLVTCFHGASTINTGFDVALSSRNSTGVQIRVLNKLIPQSALETTTAVFPGPLFHDPGSPTGLVRPSASTQAKAKKEKLVKYLADREQELSLGVGYLHAGSPEWRTADGKLVLVRLLKVLVENEGRISGTPQTESAVRTALIPHLETTVSGDSDALQASFSAIGDVHNQANENPISISTLRPSSLDKIQDFLLKGQRRQAYHYALDEKLWAHAMVIASGIDKEAWKEVVNEFLKTELGASEPSSSYLHPSGSVEPAAANGREALRVAYSLFSGQGAAAVQELVPQKSLSSIAAIGTTPLTPNFVQSGISGPIPQETLLKWTEVVAMILSGSMGSEVSAALTALGDQLNASQWTEAAHACYLLSPQTSPVGGIGHPSARITLLGSPGPQVRPSFFKDADSIIFSEILEFALSSTPTAKGQEPFGGFPHLQAYRFIRAVSLAEIGDVQLANRYCDAITASLSRASPYFTPVLLDQLKGLMDRIQGVAHIDKGNSWIGGKLSKPSLDSIGGWLEGRFTKLVTGDTESTTSPEEEAAKASQRGFVGPFSHYSTISSTTTSTSPSPQPSVINNNTLPIPRAGSAMSNRAVTNNYAPIDRASSAMDYTRRRNSPAPRAPSAASASATTATFSQSLSFGQSLSNDQSPSMEAMTPKPSDEPSESQEVSWWGSSYASNNQTPVAATFVQVTNSGLPSGDGFMSLMDNTPTPAAPTPTLKQVPHQKHEDEEEDLGFGNSKPREKKVGEDDSSSQGEKARHPAPEKPAAPEQASGGWFSRWWKGGGPVKANLGEETSFYYDKDLKRWVNKRVGASEDAKPATPPPPPLRAQTASPGMTGHNRPPLAGSTPPPARAASAIDLSNSPPPATKSVMRIRSNLVPTPEAESAPSTPTGSREGSAGPPPGRPRSQASKRNVRSRYVDVFQEGAA